MTKLFFVLLTTLFINNYALCMKRPRNETPEEQPSKKICSSEQPSGQYLPTEDILVPILISSFKMGIYNTFTAQNNIHNMSLINKSFHHHINLPCNIRKILNNLYYANPYCHALFTYSLTLPSVKKYLRKSIKLFNCIRCLTPDKIKKLVRAGADVNYFDYLDSILSRTHGDYDKTTLLLELGADPHFRNKHADVDFSSEI